LSGAVKSAARNLLHASGITAGVRFWYRKGVRILMYHRFPAQSELDAQCKHLSTYYRPVSLSTALRERPANAVVVTIDDGYRDFLTNAWPIFKAHSIPALVYVATDLPDHNSWLWTDQLTQFLREQGDLGAAETIKTRLKKIPDDKRRAYLNTLPNLRVSPPPAFAPMSWEEIRMLAKEGVEFGAHTRSHPILSRLPDQDAMRAEIGGSKERLEQELGMRIAHFCYPNGMPADYNDDVLAVVRECGFETAVTGVKGINSADSNPYLLRRLHQEPEHPVESFAHQVAGLYR
jgi:peptidoglycan/xylan/chitin deacetylase (PgdA/CDA1 family)